MKVRVAITMGDPSGVGPALVAKALAAGGIDAEFQIVGDGRVLKAAGMRRIGPRTRLLDLKNISQRTFGFGRIRAEYGRASIEYLDKALELVRDRQADCLVTCPISKEAIKLAGFRFPGHTEYLAFRAGIKDYAMLLMRPGLKLAPVTRHIRLSDVPGHLTAASVYNTIKITHKGLKDAFHIMSPRIVVCGLNPHASDRGMIGDEEGRVIIPALRRLNKTAKIHADGPISADVAISRASAGSYDCAIAMYHDQAMIPLKLSDNTRRYAGTPAQRNAGCPASAGCAPVGKTGVNMTLGLPYVRTSPLHGTAFDIAGKAGLVDIGSFMEAIRTAVKCTRNLRKN